MKIPKLNSIVWVEAYDLITFTGETSLDEDVLPVNIYGKLILADDKKVGVSLMETAIDEGKCNFDQRIYIPIGCISKITCLKKGG